MLFSIFHHRSGFSVFQGNRVRYPSMLAVGLAVSLAGLSQASAFTDSLSRAEIGPDWTIGNGTNWEISLSGLTQSNIGSVINTIYYNGGTFDAATTLSVGADFTLDISGRWAGVVFGYQDSTNFYSFRLLEDGVNDRAQLIKYVGGSISQIGTNIDLGSTLSLGGTYRLEVVQTGDSISLQVLSGETSLGSANFSDATFASGRAGVYVASNGATIANFAAVPEPSSVLMVLTGVLGGAWAARRRMRPSKA